MKITMERVIRGFQKSFGTEVLRKSETFIYENLDLQTVPRVGEYIKGGPLRGAAHIPWVKVICIYHNLDTNRVEVHLDQITRYMDKTSQYFPCDTYEEYDEKTCENFDAEIKRYEAVGWKLE